MLFPSIGAMKTIQRFATILVPPSLVVARVLYSLDPNQQFATIGNLATAVWPSALWGAFFACLYLFAMLAIESYFNTWVAAVATVCFSILSQLLFAVFLLLLAIRNQITFGHVDVLIALSIIWAFHTRDVFRTHESNAKAPAD